MAQQDRIMKDLYENYKTKVSNIFQYFHSETLKISQNSMHILGKQHQIDNLEFLSEVEKEQLKEDANETTYLINEIENNDANLVNDIEQKFKDLRKELRADQELVYNHLDNVNPKFFYNITSMFLIFLFKLIERLSETPGDLFAIYFIFCEKASVGFGLWLDQIDQMFNSDKAFYVSYYLLCLSGSKYSKIFKSDSPKLYPTASLKEIIKNRIRVLMENEDLLEIYSSICQVPQSSILKLLDIALMRTFTIKKIADGTIGYTSCFLYIFIKLQITGKFIADAAAMIIIFCHEFTNFLRKINSVSVLKNINDVTPSVDINNVEEYFIMKEMGYDIDEAELKMIISQRKLKSKKWNDTGFLLERIAFGCEVENFTMESALYLINSSDFSLSNFRRMIVASQNKGPSADSYAIKRSFARINCTTGSLFNS